MNSRESEVTRRDQEAITNKRSRDEVMDKYCQFSPMTSNSSTTLPGRQVTSKVVQQLRTNAKRLASKAAAERKRPSFGFLDERGVCPNSMYVGHSVAPAEELLSPPSIYGEKPLLDSCYDSTVSTPPQFSAMDLGSPRPRIMSTPRGKRGELDTKSLHLPVEGPIYENYPNTRNHDPLAEFAQNTRRPLSLRAAMINVAEAQRSNKVFDPQTEVEERLQEERIRMRINDLVSEINQVANRRIVNNELDPELAIQSALLRSLAALHNQVLEKFDISIDESLNI